MKKLLPIFALLSSFYAQSHEDIIVSNTEGEGFKPIEITMQMIEDRVPSFRNLWTKAVIIDNKVKVFKQDNLFTLDDTQYRDVSFTKSRIKMNGYSVDNASTSLQSEGFLSNKIRLMAGLPPISSKDNQPIMLCRIENHFDEKYYEMSVTQYETIRVAFPSNYDMGHLCTNVGSLGGYWKARLGDFYDNFGNKK
jgi:hypothetical protein